MHSQQPYSIEIITDTLFYTIVKVVLRGGVNEPTLLIDSDSLVGANLQSALNQFGGGLPLLPDIHCIRGSINHKKCSECDPSSLCSGQNYPKPACLPGNGGGNGSCGGGTTPEVYTQRDLVGFLPGPATGDFLNGGLPRSEGSTQLSSNVPILSGMSASCAKLSYVLLAGDSLDQLIDLLNKVNSGRGKQSSQKGWKHECKCEYRYYTSGVETAVLTTLDPNQGISQIIPVLNQIQLEGNEGTWRPSNGIYYSFFVEGTTEWTVQLRREGSTLAQLLQSLTVIPIDNQRGRWVEQRGCGYQFTLFMKSTSLDVRFSDVESALQMGGWSLTGLKNRVFTYVKKIAPSGQVLLRITPTQTQITVVGNEDSLDNFINEIVNPNVWQYGKTRRWEVTSLDARIAEVERGVFEITASMNTVDTIADAPIWTTEGWTVNDPESEVLSTISLDLTHSNIIALLESVGYGQVAGQTGCVTLVHSNGSTLRVSAQSITALPEIIDELIRTLLTPRTISFRRDASVSNVNSTTVQLIDTPGQGVQVIGDTSLLEQFHTEFPFLFNEPQSQNMDFLYLQSPYPAILEALRAEWDYSVVGDTVSLASLRSDPKVFIQVLAGNNTVTIWGFTEAIAILRGQSETVLGRYETSVATGETVTVYTLEGYNLHLSTGLHTYQVIAPKTTVERICEHIANPRVCIAETDLPYSSLTVSIDTPTFIRGLTQYDFGVGTAGWKQDTSCGDQNLYRFYTLEGGGVEVATAYFIYLFSIPAQDASNLASYTKVEGLEYALEQIIKPFLNVFRWNYISAGDAPTIDKPVPITLGKVVGYTGNIRKHPNCDAPTRIAITNINWTLNGQTGATAVSDRNYIELIWETEGEGTESRCCNLTGDTAYIFSGTGNYGAGSLNAVQTSSLFDGGGQPAIPNNAFPNPTGNVLFRTNGPIQGTFTVKFYKYSGYYNYLNFFDNAATNLQAAIQANELIRRDWIRVYKQQREESILIPLLYQLERNNRTALRPGPTNNGLIVHTITGIVEFTDPIPIEDTTKRTKHLELPFEFRNLLADYLGVTNSAPSVGLVNKEVIPPGDRVKYTIQYSIDAGTAQPGDVQNLMLYAQQIQARILSLLKDYPEQASNFQGLADTENFTITANISAYVIDPTSNPYLKTAYADAQNSALADAYLANILMGLDNQNRDPVRPGPHATPDSSGAIHQVGGINEANRSRWLETQVNRLIRGSEAPVPLTLPTAERPYYTFPDGSRVAGFWQNAFGTGTTVPLNPPPPLIIPESISTPSVSEFLEPPPSNTQPRENVPQRPVAQPPVQFGNTAVRGRHANTIGGNSFVYRR